MNVQDFLARLPAGPRQPQGNGAFLVQCPSHDDKKPSLSIRPTPEGGVMVKCFSGCSTFNICASVGLEPKDLFPSRNGSSSNHSAARDDRPDFKASRQAASSKSRLQRPPLSWSKFKNAWTPDLSLAVSRARGYSLAFVDQLHGSDLIGATDKGDVAFPIHMGGTVVGVHTYDLSAPNKRDAWRVDPPGFQNLWRIGDSEDSIVVFESQWDAFAFLELTSFLDSTALQKALSIWIIRGASNANSVTNSLRTGSNPRIYIFEQTDPRESPDKLSPAESLTAGLTARFARKTLVWRAPSGIHDLNDWLRQGASRESVISAMESAQPYRDPTRPPLPPRTDLDELLAFDKAKDTSALLGDRYLCRGGSCLIVGSSGIGKSVLNIQCAFECAIRPEMLGIHVHRPLRSVIIQAEDDFGDIAEMTQGIVRAMGIQSDRSTLDLLKDRVHTYHIAGKYGLEFVEQCRDLVQHHEADLLWINPLSSYFDGDLNKAQEATRFLSHLSAISSDTGVCTMVVHHTPKPQLATKGVESFTDYAYAGAGSSAFTNWARAIMVLSSVRERPDVCRLRFAKRGFRTGITDEDNPYEKIREIYLEHSTTGLAWLPSDYSPAEDPDSPPKPKTGQTEKYTFDSFCPSSWNGASTHRTDLRKLVQAHFQTKDSTACNCIARWRNSGKIILDSSIRNSQNYKIP